ncbi:hypothetical protein O1O06_11855 [Grimontia hollisae]|uniref:hypothetical protein n=1 Tax=Grimontia hollisae TaxID=673 RepID=UPI0023DB3CDC|nr:hypothetical protein [Grimontia hollisae]MDF2185457.1 hypothetical protein [Grimontia hollisae]
MAQATDALNPNAETAPKADSWLGDFAAGAMDFFGQAAGAYLEYERIQAGQDATGGSQAPVTSQPERPSQVNTAARAGFVPGVSNQMLMLGVLGLGAVILLLKK